MTTSVAAMTTTTPPPTASMADVDEDAATQLQEGGVLVQLAARELVLAAHLVLVAASCASAPPGRASGPASVVTVEARTASDVKTAKPS